MWKILPNNITDKSTYWIIWDWEANFRIKFRKSVHLYIQEFRKYKIKIIINNEWK
jgi:hypothetical protein